MRKIIFYNNDGTYNHDEELNKENIEHIKGQMSKCHLKDGTEVSGFSDPLRTYEKSKIKYDGKVHDYIYLWTWDNLDEKTHQLIGRDDERYNTTHKLVYISDIVKIETILYSNPKWGGKLTNKFDTFKK